MKIKPNIDIFMDMAIVLQLAEVHQLQLAEVHPLQLAEVHQLQLAEVHPLQSVVEAAVLLLAQVVELSR